MQTGGCLSHLWRETDRFLNPKSEPNNGKAIRSSYKTPFQIFYFCNETIIPNTSCGNCVSDLVGYSRCAECKQVTQICKTRGTKTDCELSAVLRRLSVLMCQSLSDDCCLPNKCQLLWQNLYLLACTLLRKCLY